MPLVRQAVEAGAEVIKAGILPTTEGCERAIRVGGGVPYLARGGGKVDDRDVLAATRHLLDCGAAGIVFGRNIFQHDDPAAMAAALRALVHDDASIEQAAAELGRELHARPSCTSSRSTIAGRSSACSASTSRSVPPIGSDSSRPRSRWSRRSATSSPTVPGRPATSSRHAARRRLRRGRDRQRAPSRARRRRWRSSAAPSVVLEFEHADWAHESRLAGDPRDGLAKVLVRHRTDGDAGEVATPARPGSASSATPARRDRRVPARGAHPVHRRRARGRRGATGARRPPAAA